MANTRDRLRALGPWLAVLALVAWSAHHRWAVLSSSPHPVGIDGYFYPIQIRALLETGHLAYPASPLTFWIMAAVAKLAGPIVAAKLVAAIGGALVGVPAFVLGRRLGGTLGGLAAAVVAVGSGGSFYLSLEFVKNGLGLTVALTAVWLALRALERPDRGRVVGAALGLVAALATHKMAAALAVALVVPALVVELRARLGAARAWRWIGGGAALAAVLAVALGALAPARFVAGRDLAELGAALSDDARWWLPAMHLPHRGRPDFVLALGHQALFATALALALLGVVVAGRFTDRLARPGRAAERAVGLAAAALVLVTAIPWLAVDDPDGLGFRLRVAVFAPAAVVAAALVGRLLGLVAARWHALVVVPALVVRLASIDPEPRQGLVVAHPALVSGFVTLPERLPADAVIITSERHLGFMAVWYARVPVRLRPEPVPPARRWRLLAGNRIGLGSPLDRALRAAHDQPGLVAPIGLHPRDPSGLVLVPEATWTWVLDQVPPTVAGHWRAWITR